MKYLLEAEELNCVSLENELGLKRGDIVSITTYPSGAVEIETKTELTTDTYDKLKVSLSKKNLPRGKKPVR